MIFIRTVASFTLAVSAIISSTATYAQKVCVTKGETLSQARTNYAHQCTLDRVDCDPFDGEWYCASFEIDSPTPPAVTVNNTLPMTQRHPVCLLANSDSDGDGYGWENHATCLVIGSTNSVGIPQSVAPNARPICARNDSDSDGDGFGWENHATCLVANNPITATTPVTTLPANAGNEDNDAIQDAATVAADTAEVPVRTDSAITEARPELEPAVGIEAPVAIAEPAPVVVMPQSEPASDITVNGSVTAADITDLILVTGQSNTLGAGTAYDPLLDAPNDRVFAFTDRGWQVANLNQIWDHDWHPRNHPETDPSNNFSLHFGKSVASADSSRVTAFILASSPGSKIEVWNKGSSFYNTVQNKVLDALNQLPHKDAIDGILWHQGESDGQDIPSYTVSLNALISNLRNEQWVENQAPFICGETKIASVNRRLNGLNDDNDPNTACVQAIDLSTRDGTHFDAPALRILGARYAETWLNITR